MAFVIIFVCATCLFAALRFATNVKRVQNFGAAGIAGCIVIALLALNFVVDRWIVTHAGAWLGIGTFLAFWLYWRLCHVDKIWQVATKTYDAFSVGDWRKQYATIFPSQTDVATGVDAARRVA